MKPCLILGNGPSLNDLPPELLASPGDPPAGKRMASFGMNYAKFQPTYYVCVDSRVLTEHPQAIHKVAAAADVAYLSSKHNVNPLYALPNVELIWKDDASFRAEKYMTGMTATYVCLKLAYYAGFQEVHLWGVDHSPDWKHYRDDYPPDLAATRRERMRIMEWHYQLAMNVYARAGRRIINHSHPSRLDMIFRRGRIEAGDKT